jgi:hypothetical protein
MRRPAKRAGRKPTLGVHARTVLPTLPGECRLSIEQFAFNEALWRAGLDSAWEINQADRTPDPTASRTCSSRFIP